MFITHKCRQVAFPYIDVTLDGTSKHVYAATDYTLVRVEEPEELLGDLVERGHEAKIWSRGFASLLTIR